MTRLAEQENTFLKTFQRRQGGGNGQPWINHLRQAGIDRFREVGFPGSRDEEWRFTNLAPITRTAFQPASADVDDLVRRQDPDEVQRIGAGERDPGISGRLAPDLAQQADRVGQGELLAGEATRVSGDDRKGVASAYGPRGTYASCEYQMNTPYQGAGSCTFSNGAKYQVHIGS